MNQVTASIGLVNYRTELISTAGKNQIIADEGNDAGGQNAGFTPSELLNAALAACTDITLRMYAERKKWNLQSVTTIVSFHHDSASNTSAVKREISITGNLTPEQKQRLLDVANKCPLHEVLNNPIAIDTRIA